MVAFVERRVINHIRSVGGNLGDLSESLPNQGEVPRVSSLRYSLIAIDAAKQLTPRHVVTVRHAQLDPTIFWDKSRWVARCERCHYRKTVTRDGGSRSASWVSHSPVLLFVAKKMATLRAGRKVILLVQRGSFDRAGPATLLEPYPSLRGKRIVLTLGCPLSLTGSASCLATRHEDLPREFDSSRLAEAFTLSSIVEQLCLPTICQCEGRKLVGMAGFEPTTP